MTSKDLGQLLRDLAPYASLAVIVIAGWRLFRRINEAETKLARLNKDLAEINSVLFQVRLDAEKVGRSLPDQVQGLEHYQKWDTRHVRSLMRSAKRRVWIIHTWFPEMEADINEWTFDHPRRLDVRILLASASNPAVLERVRFRGDFQKDPSDEDRRRHIAQVTDACEAMIQQRLDVCGVKGTIARYVRGMPFGPIYLIDDHAIFGVYPPHQNSNYGPMLRVGTAASTGVLLEESFDRFWQSGRNAA